MDNRHGHPSLHSSRVTGLWLSAWLLASTGTAQALQISSDMYVTANATSLHPAVGTPTSASDAQTSGAAEVGLSLGRVDVLGKPAVVSGLSTEDGIVLGKVRTGQSAYEADTTMKWHARFIKDSPTATFDFSIPHAYLWLTDGGGLINDHMHASFRFLVESGTNHLADTNEFEHAAKISGRAGSASGDNFDKDHDVGPLSTHYIEVEQFGNVGLAVLDVDPFTGSVDLSRFGVGDVFDIFYLLELTAKGVGGETRAVAQFRDPANGISTTISGLTPVLSLAPPANPVPAPSTMLLLAGGLLGLLGGRPGARPRAT